MLEQVEQDEPMRNWQNLCLAVVVDGLKDSPKYLTSTDCGWWLDKAGIDDLEPIAYALKQTKGKLKGARFISDNLNK